MDPEDAGVAAADAAPSPDAADTRDAGARPPTSVRFANLTARALDLCVGPTAATLTGPLFASSGGVPPGEVSAYAPAETRIDYFQKYVLAGETCTSTAGGFNATRQPGNSVLRRTMWLGDEGSVRGGGEYDDGTPNPALDTVRYVRVQSIDATLRFVPDDAQLPATPIPQRTPVTLDPTHPGRLVGDVPEVGTPPDRPYLPLAGGLATVFVTGAKIIVCDDLAPPVGGLSDCRDTVR